MTPVLVDREARRAELSELVLDLVAELGLEGVTVRALADAAGVSIGTVQHYFPSKDALLLHAQARANDAVGARADEAAAGARGPREALAAIAAAILPTNETSARDVRVFLAFETRALNVPRLAARARRDDEELTAGLAELFRLAGVEAPRREAVAFVALVGGLCQPLLRGTCTPAEAAAIVDLQLERALR
jgi:AcrR family transcriptional regulator